MPTSDILNLFENEAQSVPDEEIRLMGATLGVDPLALIAAIREFAVLEALELELATCSSASIDGADLDIIRRDGTRLQVVAGGDLLLDAVIAEAEAVLADARG